MKSSVATINVINFQLIFEYTFANFFKQSLIKNSNSNPNILKLSTIIQFSINKQVNKTHKSKPYIPYYTISFSSILYIFAVHGHQTCLNNQQRQSTTNNQNAGKTKITKIAKSRKFRSIHPPPSPRLNSSHRDKQSPQPPSSTAKLSGLGPSHSAAPLIRQNSYSIIGMCPLLPPLTTKYHRNTRLSIHAEGEGSRNGTSFRDSYNRVYISRPFEKISKNK